MIISDEVEIKGHPRNIKHFKSKGYDLKVGQKIKVDPKDLSKGSTFVVLCGCDNCSSEKKLPFKEYYLNTKSLKEHYYCAKYKYTFYL